MEWVEGAQVSAKIIADIIKSDSTGGQFDCSSETRKDFRNILPKILLNMKRGRAIELAPSTL